MWGRKRPEPAPAAESKPDEKPPQRLRDALRQARIESAERTGVIVDMRDAEVARLEILNEALEPLFKDIPDDMEMFDRGLSRGDQPRLWIDVVAHVDMGRDKRTYRFVQDTRYGRKIGRVGRAGRDRRGRHEIRRRRIIERSARSRRRAAAGAGPGARQAVAPQDALARVRAFLFGSCSASRR